MIYRYWFCMRALNSHTYYKQLFYFKTKKIMRKLNFIYILTVIIITVILFHYYNERLNNIHNAKLGIMQEVLEEAEIKLLIQSDIETLESYARENASLSKWRLEEISKYKDKIIFLEELYEDEVLSQRCFEHQIDRKINWLEYSIEYCNAETNLDQFRTKKY